MSTISPDELIAAFAAAARGQISRSQAAAWARERMPRHGEPGPFPGTPAGRLSLVALGSIASADLSERLELQDAGEPYFLREHDLREWWLTLRQKDWIGKHPHALRPKRPHQARMAEVAAFLRLPVSAAAQRLQVRSLRGQDDFDYFEQILFDDRKGRQIVLEWRPRAPTEGADLWLERGMDAEAVLHDLLRSLGCDEGVVAWRRDGASNG